MIACSSTLTTDRITASLSIMDAWRGMSSDSRTPGTLVLIAENSPRNSFGASGFGS